MPFNRLNRGKSLSKIQGTLNVSESITAATGGAVTYAAGKTIHTFTGTGPLSLSSSTNPATVSYSPSTVSYRKIGSTVAAAAVEYLVVAGGSSGDGGHQEGGAGGQVLIGSTPVSSPRTITVGGGGPATPNDNDVYNIGNPSSFGPEIIATGGAAGGPGVGPAPENAAIGSFGIGSGGSNSVSGPTLENRRGGNGLQSSISGTNLYYGGGGGGAGGAGYETSQGGRGGYGGGGGGGTGPGGSGGTPGNQNGTYGSPTGPGGDVGAINSGGGGGSGGIGFCGPVYCPGRQGGSGIVIIAYPS